MTAIEVYNLKGDLHAHYDLQNQDKAFQTAWLISQAYDIELNQNFYGSLPPERISYMTASDFGSSMVQIGKSMVIDREGMASMRDSRHTLIHHKRTLFVSDHRNN